MVPPQAVNQAGSEDSRWLHGGSAGLLNYDASYMNSSGGVSFAQIASEVGLNVSDWILRSRQTLSRFNGENNIHHQATYAQRSFASIKKCCRSARSISLTPYLAPGRYRDFRYSPNPPLTNREGPGWWREWLTRSQSLKSVSPAYWSIIPSFRQARFAYRDFPAQYPF